MHLPTAHPCPCSSQVLSAPLSTSSFGFLTSNTPVLPPSLELLRLFRLCSLYTAALTAMRPRCRTPRSARKHIQQLRFFFFPSPPSRLSLPFLLGPDPNPRVLCVRPAPGPVMSCLACPVVRWLIGPLLRGSPPLSACNAATEGSRGTSWSS